ncbi:unnamed protein product [Bursaphelenchus xylophilus]|uniref:(pine wood nematode) hypothetical protein n=1 Tax=Bursaphelenchus xylophilus TaxID=6326 RepID=A0A1I7S7P0_BURXY|nr:unnamed protein product [Bursaphelenchus xylophilus]CAG9112047.1 unnamed protein product [Bursaphelenchus xylophilus]
MVGRFLLLALLISSVFGGKWYCGPQIFEALTSDFIEGRIWNMCPEHYTLINECCRIHDMCYSEGNGHAHCDHTFFKCLNIVKQDCPRTYGWIELSVRHLGEIIYIFTNIFG